MALNAADDTAKPVLQDNRGKVLLGGNGDTLEGVAYRDVAGPYRKAERREQIRPDGRLDSQPYTVRRKVHPYRLPGDLRYGNACRQRHRGITSIESQVRIPARRNLGYRAWDRAAKRVQHPGEVDIHRADGRVHDAAVCGGEPDLPQVWRGSKERHAGSVASPEVQHAERTCSPTHHTGRHM